METRLVFCAVPCLWPETKDLIEHFVPTARVLLLLPERAFDLICQRTINFRVYTIIKFPDRHQLIRIPTTNLRSYVLDIKPLFRRHILYQFNYLLKRLNEGWLYPKKFQQWCVEGFGGMQAQPLFEYF